MSRKTHNPDLEAKFLNMYDEHADTLFRYVSFKVSDKEKAKDLVQETFLKVWEQFVERSGTETELQNPKAFLFRVATNLVIDTYRKKKEISLDALVELGADFGHDTSGHIVDKAEIKHLIREIEKLDEIDRDLILLRYVDGFSIPEIADISGQRENTVSVRIHRVIKQLQEKHSM
jgi:RNA polymerase sigma-70 factor, ECF subfamily